MREIKFRGKTVEADKWVYGCLTRYSEVLSYITEDLIEQKVYGVKTETIGQYTGLKDKNGKEIYEDDIVYMRCDGLSGFGEVIFENGCFWIDDKKRKRTYPLYNEGEYKVDGNVFENPELLEE